MKACVLQPLWATSCQHSHVLLLLHPPGALCTSHSPPSMCIFHSFLQWKPPLCCVDAASIQTLPLDWSLSLDLMLTCSFFRPWQQEINYSHISHLCALEATVRWRGSKANSQYMWDPQRGAWWMILGLLSEKTHQLPPGAHHLRFCLKPWRNSPPKIMALFTVQQQFKVIKKTPQNCSIWLTFLSVPHTELSCDLRRLEIDSYGQFFSNFIVH